MRMHTDVSGGDTDTNTSKQKQTLGPMRLHDLAIRPCYTTQVYTRSLCSVHVLQLRNYTTYT